MKDLVLKDSHRKDFHVFEPFIGRSLESLNREIYYFNGKADDEDDGVLELKFANYGAVTLGISSDGESVVAEGKVLTKQEPFTIDRDSQCDWRIVELSENIPWSNLLGRPLSQVHAMVDHPAVDDKSKLYVSGWLIWFGDDFFGYYNFGDKSKLMFNEPAPPVENLVTTFERVAPTNAS